MKKAVAFASVFCRFYTPTSISFNGQTERINAELVSGSFFEALGCEAGAGPRLHARSGRSRVQGSTRAWC